MKANTFEDILDRIEIDYETGCWIWTGNKSQWGYGTCSLASQKWNVHRLMYDRLVSPIPTGMQIDHLCKNPACCNVDHLEIVTPEENNRRKDRLIHKPYKQSTHCRNGHEYTIDNLLNYRNDRHKCKICYLAKQDRRQNKERTNNV